MIPKSTKRSHDHRYAYGIQRKRSIRKTINYDAYVAARQRRNKAHPQSTNSTTDTQASNSALTSPLMDLEADLDVDFDNDGIDGDYSDGDAPYTSPAFNLDSDDLVVSPAEASSQCHRDNTPDLNSALEDDTEEQESYPVYESTPAPDNRIQPPSEEPERPLEPMEIDSIGTASLDSILFRFEVPDPPLPASEAVYASSDSWFWRIILLFVSWAHVSFHVPVRVLEVLLKLHKSIYIAWGKLDGAEEVPVTVKTTFKSLGLEDNFIVFAMCSSCRRIFQREDLGENLDCTNCNQVLFHEAGKQKKSKNATQNLRPCLQFPFRPLSSQLPELLNREGIEDALDSWRARESDEVLRDIMDGDVWKELKGHNKKPFFDNDEKREDKDELRIGITLGFDGYVFLY